MSFEEEEQNNDDVLGVRIIENRNRKFMQRNLGAHFKNLEMLSVYLCGNEQISYSDLPKLYLSYNIENYSVETGVGFLFGCKTIRLQKSLPVLSPNSKPSKIFNFSRQPVARWKHFDAIDLPN